MDNRFARLWISLFALTGVVVAQPVVHLKTTEKVLASAEISGSVAEALSLPAKRLNAQRSHLIVQFPEAPSQEQIDELGRRGAMRVGYVPDFGLMLSVPDNFAVEDLRVSGAGRLYRGEKVSPLLSGKVLVVAAADNDGKAIQPREYVVIEFHSDVDLDDARVVVLQSKLEIV